MTWGHRRAIDPLTGTLASFRELHPDIDVDWQARSLAGFEFQPVEELARDYDLIILDHPFMGDAAAKGCLRNLVPLLEGRDSDYVGPSLATYRYGDAVLALPVDAAAQVAAYRPDLMARLDTEPPRSWKEVTLLSKRACRQGLQLAIAYSGVHGLMTFYTLMASLGRPCSHVPGGSLCDRAAAREALGLMRSLARFCPETVFDWNSIALHEALASDERLAYCPAVYCYATYAEDDRAHPLRFADLPGAASTSPHGSTIGGTGLAVSASCRAPEEAMAYVHFAAAPKTQISFALNHGQPAHIEAWEDDELDRRFGGTFSATRATLEGAWIRPRYAGYLGFQKRGGALMEQHLRGNLNEAELLDALEKAFAASGDPS
jgi:multiple sugar transport system substrate-binding protein